MTPSVTHGYCETCHFRDDRGFCNSPKLGEACDKDGSDSQLLYSYDEGGGFNVGPKFGCVHWVEKQST